MTEGEQKAIEKIGKEYRESAGPVAGALSEVVRNISTRALSARLVKLTGYLLTAYLQVNDRSVTGVHVNNSNSI